MTLWYLLEKEFKQFFRDPGLPKMAIAFPVLMMLVFPFAVSMEIRNINLVVVDENRTEVSSELIQTCTASGYFNLVEVSSNPERAMDLMDRNRADAILTIGSDLDRKLGRGEDLPIGIKVNTINGTKGSIGAGYLTSSVRQFYARKKAGQAESAASFSLDVSPKYYFNPFLDYKKFMVPALIVIAITMLTGFFPALNIVSEKERGTIEQINVTPVRRSAFILCKMIPYWLVAFFVLSACLLIAWLVYGYNGKLPPWKGDYHHDLNTELSYWPAYTGNHLKEGMGYLNTIWNQRDTYRKWTRQYFETEGLNVPGVATLTGEPMGGWIQYAMSQTAGAWIGQHFYLHWKYSADKEFLKEKGYPYVRDVATFLEQISEVDKSTGVRRLEFSSSPEIFDNSIQAWFKTMTNYDLSLMTFIFRAASEMADALQLPEEAEHWRKIAGQLPDYDLADDGSLTFAKGFPYEGSHRHFSHAMAIHPLGLIDWSDGPEAQRIIRATVKRLDQYGPDYWTGYSYAWLGNMKARMFDGEGAAKALRTFAECFCLKNTFHANGDQSGTGKSLFTYRPFTLEGNFAFAAGVQEMLLQSHTDVIQIFPAIPADWKDVSFEKLRAMGGVLISASMKNGKVDEVRICSEVGGDLTLGIPDGFGQRKTIQVHAPKGKWISVDLGNR